MPREEAHQHARPRQPTRTSVSLRRRTFSLEEALEYIEDDELVEVTPDAIRLRKRLLDENDRKKQTRVGGGDDAVFEDEGA